MTALYSLRTAGDIVHVQLSPRFVIKLRHMMPLWAEVLDTVRDRQLRRVLIEGDRPPREMRPREVETHGDFLGSIERPGLRVAFCLRGYQADALTEQFRLVANSGASSVKFFDDPDAARAWLEQGVGGRGGDV